MKTNALNIVYGNDAKYFGTSTEKKSIDFGKIVATALVVIFVIGMTIIVPILCKTVAKKRVELEQMYTEQQVQQLDEFINNMK